VTRAPRGMDVAGEVWSMMANLVINNERKREVREETGLSFAKTRALRRIAGDPMSMGELASLLAMDPPNVTTLVDDLQRAGLAQRQPHRADRRIMLVMTTAAGAKLAQRVEDILDRPPEELLSLPIGDLEELRRILSRVR
jgi:DNA-binding MarR family transcriptional regulator